MNDKHDETRGESVEAAVLRRRNLLKKSVILGVPLLLTLPGRAFAQSTNGSISMSENLSRQNAPKR
ncbi:MAG: hypothetical protein ACHQ1G_11355 [Planctomycetota bacterium]